MGEVKAESHIPDFAFTTVADGVMTMVADSKPGNTTIVR